ncbi:hypothetical protein ABRG53_3868 [Pseudanabaena sp. ABRG5-3]|nr:hypothetical protein ABRG53_3868 [Pseudanabaena sp. ABRG5-3]
MSLQANVNKAIYSLRQQGILKLVLVQRTDYIAVKATDSELVFLSHCCISFFAIVYAVI